MNTNMNIYEKLIEVRKSVPYLQKGESGPQFKYVSSSQVLANCKAKMDELKLLLIPQVLSNKVTESTVEYVEKDRPKRTTTYFTELEIEYTWLNVEKPDEKITCRWYGQGVDIAGEKGVGKALTYAEKYFMLKFFNIIPTDEDDPDSFQGNHSEDKKPNALHKPQETTSSKQQETASFKCEDCGTGITEKIKNYSQKQFHKDLCINCQKKVAMNAKN